MLECSLLHPVFNSASRSIDGSSTPLYGAPTQNRTGDRCLQDSRFAN